MISRTLKVIENPEVEGEFLLDLGLELCKELGWSVGDTIQWINNQDGTWTLRKTQDSKS